MDSEYMEDLRLEKDIDTFILSPDKKFLPILRYKLQILYLVEQNNIVVVIGETGCGKSTQIPRFLYEVGWPKKICVVLTRRIAAVTLAGKLAQELARVVGYKIRFDDRTGEETRIVYMTEGVLLKEIQKDPLLNSFTVIIFDDAHERSVSMDVLLGVTKKILLKREDLKVIITSATISAETYIEYFNEFKVEAITIEGRTHPVDIYYLASPCKNYIEKAIETALAIHKSQPPGDILVFLTGQEDISAFISALSQENSLTVLPLHASLSTENQLKVFSTAHPHRKIIASTNIAETAVTIEGILYVIDCCFVKQKTFIGGFECLSTFPISKAQAVQRAGRAGRLRPGKCYRLCTESSFSALRNENIAEILRVDLSPTIVYLKSLCIHNIPAFPFITQPHKNSILTALEMLYNLGAIDENGFLTSEVGEALVELPIDHKLAVVLLNSCTENFRCSKEILSIVAMLSVQGIFNGRPNENILMTKRRLGAKEGDHPSLLNIFEQFAKIPSFNERKKFCQDHRLNMRALQRVGKIRDQLRGILQKLRLNIVSCEYDVESILRCLVTGLFSNAAQREPNGVYRISNCNEEFQLHPSSILSVIKPEWLVFTEVLQTDKKYLVDASEIDADWLYELAPNYFTDTRDIKMHMQHKKLLS